MMNISWLSQEAHSIHGVFVSLFYGMMLIFMLIGVISELLSLPIGSFGWTPQLVGRVIIAAFLMHAYPEMTNLLGSFADMVASKIGGFNEFHHVLTRMGTLLKSLTWSWPSVKGALILGFSFITFFLLYMSVYIASAGVIFVWLLLYVFSPILIAFFVLPSTSHITKSLYRALFEVSAWKIVWATLAALLWSLALSQITKSDVNFITIICLNIVLALSLLFTPVIVHLLASQGITSIAVSGMGLAAGAAAFTPGALATRFAKKAVTTGGRAAGSGLLMGAESARIAMGKKPIRSRSPGPPKWIKEVPLPDHPPPWLESKLNQERNDKGGIKK